MTSKAAAHRYARALFDVAVKEQQNLDEIEAQLAEFVDLFKQYPTLEKVLLNPAVPVPRKRAAVAELTTTLGVTAMLAKLLALLADRDRLVVLPDLLAAYRERLLEHRDVDSRGGHDGSAAVRRARPADRAAPGGGHRQDGHGLCACRSVDYRRRGHAHRRHGLRLERDASVGEDEKSSRGGCVSGAAGERRDTPDVRRRITDGRTRGNSALRTQDWD